MHGSNLSLRTVIETAMSVPGRLVRRTASRCFLPVRGARLFSRGGALAAGLAVLVLIVGPAGPRATGQESEPPPVADAGFNRTVAAGAQVVLDGTGSIEPLKNKPVTFAWSLVSKPAASAAVLDDATAVKPRFTPDLAGDYVVELVVTSNKDLASAPARITVSTVNSVPVADAGADQLVALAETVTLDGSGSFDADGDALSFAWVLDGKPAGSGAALSDPAAVRPAFIVDQPGDYVAVLTVTDAGGRVSAADEVTVSTESVPPAAQGGRALSLGIGETAEVDGERSTDAMGLELERSWELTYQPPGSSVKLVDGSTQERQQLTPEVDGTYVMQLELTDLNRPSEFDTIAVSTGNSPPVAEAGPDRAITPGEPVTLDGSASSDVNGNLLTYRWALTVRPVGSTAQLNDPDSIRPRFTPDLPGTYVAQLVVDDGTETGRPDTALLSTENVRPVADAGPDRFGMDGDSIQLDGSGSSDPEGAALTYEWSLTGRPDGSSTTLSATDVVNPTMLLHKPTKTGCFVAQLTVSDGFLESAPDVMVVCEGGSNPPVAVAGEDRTVVPGDVVQLSGSGSTDPDGDPLTYRWALISVPDGSTAALSDPTAPNPTFTADADGLYVAQLIVSDGLRQSVPATVVVDANSLPVFTSEPVTTVIVDTLYSYDVDASDPAGDSIFYSLDAAPEGMEIDAASGLISWTPDTAGEMVNVTVRATDERGGVATQSFTVTVQAPPFNRPPELAPIGPQSVELGKTLRLTLTASDPDGDALSFVATPVPLPAGVSLDGTTGELTFRPTTDQAGTLDLTFTVSDGTLTDSETVTITVSEPSEGTVTTLTGILLDADDLAAGVQTPVVGATLSYKGTTLSTTTDALGGFTLAGTGGGLQDLIIDGGTASAAPDGSAYLRVETEVELIPDAVNDFGTPFTVGRLDSDSVTTVDPTVTTVVENSALGVSLSIPPDSARNADGSLYTGAISISDIAPAPSQLPPFIEPCQVVTIQPLGLTFSVPAAATLPNLDGLPPGSRVDIWAVDSAGGTLTVVGEGRVSADGTQITTASGGLSATGMLFAVPAAPQVAASTNHNSGTWDPNRFADGNLRTSFSTPSYRSLGVDRSQTLTYNSTSAAAAPIVAAEATVPAETGLPATLSSRLEIGGAIVAGPVYTSTSTAADPDDPGLQAGEAVRLPLQFDGGGLSTGSYPFRMVATANYACSRVGTAVNERVLVSNESASPFGPGWTLEGLERLYPQPDGTVVLSDGTGRLAAFKSTAALSGETGATLPVLPPPSVEPGARESDTKIVIFTEAENREVTADVRVNANSFREYTSTSHLENGIIPSGARVNSYLVHFDPVGLELEMEAVEGTITFASDIVGVILLDADLDASDGQFGAEGTVYPTGGSRGLELGSDVVSIGADLRTLTVRLVAGTSVDQIRILTVAGLRELVASRFDESREGWTGFNDFRNFRHVPTGGNPGGYIAVDDVLSGFSRMWRYVAPAKFRGDKSEAYNGWLTYELKQTPVTSQIFRNDEIILIGAGKTLRFNFPYNPVDIFWTRYAALLNEKAGWILVGPNRPPTQAEFQAVLADIDAIRILGEYRDGRDTGAMDNTVIWAPVAEPDQVAHISPPGEFSRLVRNPDGTYTRILTDGVRIEYDASGVMTQRADLNGNTTGYEYDAQGRLIRITDPFGNTTTLTYGADGTIASMTDPAGRTVNYEVDPVGPGSHQIVNADGSTRTYEFDEGNKILSELSERGFTTTHEYGFAGGYLGSGYPDESSIAVSYADQLGLADLGLGLGTPSSPAGFTRPGQQEATLTDGRGNLWTLKLNAFGSPVQITDPIGRVTVLDRDEANRVFRVTRPSDGELPDGTKPGQMVSELDYDGRNNIIAMREAVGTPLERETRFDFLFGLDRITRIIDPAGFQTLFDYDESANLSKITDAEGGEQVFTYDERGRPLTAQDANQNVTHLAYDAAGNLATVTDALGNVSELTRDDAGNVLTRTDGLSTGGTQGGIEGGLQLLALSSTEGRTVTYEYDELNRIIAEIDGEGGRTEYDYDAEGNRIRMTDPTGIVTTWAYDELNRMVQVNDPAYGAVTQSFDEAGNVVSVSDALGGIEIFEYDAVNRNIGYTDARSYKRSVTYTAGDLTASITDANSNVTSFTYDLLRRKKTRTNPLGEVWLYTWDSRDNRTGVEDAKGQSFTFAWDKLSRITGVTAPTDTLSFTWDPAGNLLTANDINSALTWTYDALNRAATATTVFTSSAQTATLTYEYDGLSRRTALIDSEGGRIDTDYDLADSPVTQAMTSSAVPVATPLTLTWDAARRSTGITFPNGVVQARDYDTSGRLNILSHILGGTPLASLTHSYDAVGRVTGIQSLNDAKSFTYDLMDQILTAGTVGAPEAYSYEPEGNRESSHLSALHVADNANRLVEDEDYTYTYDLNGNLTSKTEKATGDITTYEYDSFDRLLRVTRPDASVITYAWDALGRRIEKNVAGNIRRYVYDHEDIVLEFDGSGTLQARYAHGPDIDQPLEMERGGQRYHYQADHLGSIRQLTDETGTPVNEYDYDAYGNFTALTEAVENPFAFTGREYDAETGLYHYRDRAYDQETGRFLQEDPIWFEAGDLNLYRYVRNDPIDSRDPYGLFVFGEYANLTCFSVEKTTEFASVFTPELQSLYAYNSSLVQSVIGFVLSASPTSANSFAAGTPVLMADGSSRPIELVQVGDLIMSRPEAGGEAGAGRVTARFAKVAKRTIRLTLRGDDGKTSETLTVTEDHPFHVEARGWTAAGKLAPRDQISDRDGGEPVTVEAVQTGPSGIEVFNLEVAEGHTYFAGDSGAWAHNVQRGIGRSGKPKLHFPRFAGRKKAREAARHAPGSRGSALHYKPKKGGCAHFHSVDKKGKIIKDGVHYVFGKQRPRPLKK